MEGDELGILQSENHSAIPLVELSQTEQVEPDSSDLLRSVTSRWIGPQVAKSEAVLCAGVGRATTSVIYAGWVVRDGDEAGAWESGAACSVRDRLATMMPTTPSSPKTSRTVSHLETPAAPK